MSYSELIKNFDKIRNYIREFYVYGLKNRNQYSAKSLRSYDNEKRRLESWLGGYMNFKQNSKGKNFFISVDSRSVSANPLFKAWKSKSFTDGDITLHFIIFDILYKPDISLTLKEITYTIETEYLSFFDNAKTYDESTIRKKLSEYVREGVLIADKDGKSLRYRCSEFTDTSQLNGLLCYFSEIIPCGVVGSFILDKNDSGGSAFNFKHHYITGTMDSEVMYRLFDAMRLRRTITADYMGRMSTESYKISVVPLKIFISVQNGRQYLLACRIHSREINAFRLDCLSNVKQGEVCPIFDALKGKLNRMQRYIWGVNTNSLETETEHVRFTVHFNDDEQFVFHRLEREKRCGKVVLLDDNTAEFSADVYDATELVTWIRTFIGRLESVEFSDKETERVFLNDLKEMYSMYGLGEE